MLKLTSTPELAHPYQVVRDDGLIDVVLTLFAENLLKSLSPSSVPIYMREVVAAFNWAVDDKVVMQNQWGLFGSPVEVRNLVREYLTVGAKCKLRRRPDRLGVQVTYVHPSDDTRINVRIFLAALRRFYDYLIAGHPSSKYGAGLSGNDSLRARKAELQVDVNEEAGARDAGIELVAGRVRPGPEEGRPPAGHRLP